MIAPPYTQEFVNLFLPLIENDGITGTLRSDDGNDPVSEFICKYHQLLGLCFVFAGTMSVYTSSV